MAIILGAVLRLGTLSTIAVEHFDEAVYASNLLFSGEDGNEFPLRQFYAPPLLPAAIEWTTIFGQMLFGSTPTWWPMLPGLLAGLATIPSAWWILRQWFGPAAGVAAALLIACDEFHASFSRTALTDVPLSFFVLWAVYWFWRALPTGEFRPAILAGTFTALAWWTKYNGWLPLAIAAAGGMLWQLALPAGERNWRRCLRNWSLAAVTALTLWSPVLWDCQKVGGYAKVAENHRGYVTGLPQWLPNLVQGCASLNEFTGWITLAGIGLAFAGGVSLRRGGSAEMTPGQHVSGRVLAESLISAWIWGLIIATPMYYPYSRLWVPCWLALMLGIGMLVAELRVGSIRSLAGISRTGLRFAGLSGILLILASALSTHPPWELPSCFEPRNGIWRVCGQVRLRVADRQALLVVGASDPAIWFHLRRDMAQAVMQSDFGFADTRPPHSLYAILGPLAQQMDNVQQDWKKHEHQFEFVEEFACPVSRISLLDLHSPRDLTANPRLRVPTIRLNRLRN